jgi:hypothetical protein
MDMTPADWLDVTPSEWMERAMPGWRAGAYGDLMQRSPRDWLSMASGTAVQNPWATATTWPTTRPKPRHRHQHHRHHRHECHCADEHDHRCRDCGTDACECYCCIGDVDLVVYARVGETRVVPITVENERRRETEVKAELSTFTTRGGKEGLVQGAVRPEEFKLEPCGHQNLVLVFRAAGQDKAADHVRTADAVQQRELPDVDTCEVLTADLRLVGCDHRSIRIAAAILPRDCDPFRVSCGCTCC